MQDYKIKKIQNTTNRLHQTTKRQRGFKKENRKIEFAKFFRNILIIVACWGIGILGWKVYQDIVKLPYFQLSKIVVRGVNHLKKEDIVKLSNIQIGSNLAEIDLKEIADRIQEHPWVKKVGIKRKVPDEIILEVQERVPIALAYDRGFYLVDERGIIEKAGKANQRFLPVIRGLNLKGGSATDDEVRAKLVKGQEIIKEIKRAKLFELSEIAKIDMTNFSDVVIYTKKSIEIRLGAGEYRDKFERLAAILDDLYKRVEKIKYIDLRYREKVTVMPAETIKKI